MPLFEVAIVRQPHVKSRDQMAELEQLILPPVAIVSKDEKSASLSVLMRNRDKIQEGWEEEITVLVRPFPCCQ